MQDPESCAGCFPESSMKLVALVAFLGLAGSLVWGALAASRPAAPRSEDTTTPVTEAWREALPRDPGAATRAYLARVPPEMRARGAAMSRTRYGVLGARIVLTIGGIALFLFSGAAASLASFSARITRLRWLQTLLFTAVLFTLLHPILLPVSVY